MVVVDAAGRRSDHSSVSVAPPRQAVLDFSNAYHGDDKCGDIVAAVRGAAPQPVALDLRGNRFEAAGARLLADMLRATHSVVSLSLEWNNVGLLNEGVEALAAALEVDATLLELDLRNNNIGPDGARALARALHRNRTLRKLDLRWNEIGNAGVLAFLEALQANDALLVLELTGNNSSFKHAEEIERLLVRNRSIQGQQRPPVQIEDEQQEQQPSSLKAAVAPVPPPTDQLLLVVLGEKEALETDLQIAKRLNVKMTEKVEEGELQLQLTRRECDSAKQDRDRFQQRELDAKAEAHEARMRFEELENRRRVEFEEYRAARAALERECGVLRDKLSHAEALHHKSDDQKSQQLAQLDALKYQLESEVHRLQLAAGSQHDEFQKLKKELSDAAIEHERKSQSLQAAHRAELAAASRQSELTVSALQSQLSFVTEQLEETKRTLSTVKDRHDALQAHLLQEHVAHEKQIHEMKRQWETESQERLQNAIHAVEAQVEEIRKSRVFLEQEVDKHTATVARLRQENLALQQTHDERLAAQQRDLDRQYQEIQERQDQAREAQKVAIKANEKLEHALRRLEEQEKNAARMRDAYDERLREQSASTQAAVAHHRAAVQEKSEVIARLESAVLRAERTLSQQIHASEQRFDGLADAMAAFLQDQVKRERVRRQTSRPTRVSNSGDAPSSDAQAVDADAAAVVFG